MATPTSAAKTLRYSCQRDAIDYGADACQSLSGTVLESFVVERLLQAVSPASLELSLTASEDIERERKQLDDHWQQRRARFAPRSRAGAAAVRGGRIPSIAWWRASWNVVGTKRSVRTTSCRPTTPASSGTARRNSRPTSAKQILGAVGRPAGAMARPRRPRPKIVKRWRGCCWSKSS